jgi:hypothetical protein
MKPLSGRFGSSVPGMYLRTIQRKNKDGTVVRYIQLAHNEWDPVKKTSVAKVVHSFGREDTLDRDSLQRMIASVARYLGVAAPASAEGGGGAEPPERLRPVASRPLGGGWLLDGLWRQLGIDKIITGLLKGRRLDPSAERVLFMLVANRALAPTDHKSKLASLSWLDDVHLPGVADLGDDPNVCYRAMDFLLEIEDDLAEQVYWAVADLLDLEVDLLLFDTTSTYWETDRADAAAGEDAGPTAEQTLPDDDSDDGRCRSGFRTYGRSKDLPSHCVVSHSGVANSPGCSPSTWIRRPSRLPRRTCTALSSPRWTRCNTVCRAMPRMAAA